MQPISLILASGSPRRHELLTQLGFQVQKQPADIDETRQNGEAPEDYVARLAVEKKPRCCRTVARYARGERRYLRGAGR